MVKEKREAKRGVATAAEAAVQFAAKIAKEKPQGTKYKAETYMVVARWTEDTRVKYGPNLKTPGSKSYPRYERYAKAKTIGEALRLGAYPADLLWDYERGFYKVVGGPTREEPVDIHRAQVEGLKLSQTDLMLGKWFLKELCKDLGTDPKSLLKGVTWAESALMRALRLLSDREAESILAKVSSEGREVRNEELLSVLRKWCYWKNPWRLNVMKQGQTWVNSDTVGLNAGRDGDVHATRPTFAYPNVMRVMARWIRERQPPELHKQFYFTSINMNFGYAASRHRDGNNVGLSMLAAFGDFKGGKLRYWPDDDKSAKPAELPSQASITVDLKDSLLLFDGQRCHEVMPFQGERYSLVWFSCARYWTAGKDTLQKLARLGFEIPTEASIRGLSRAIRPPRGHSGRALGRGAAGKGLPGSLHWPGAPAMEATCPAGRGKRRRSGHAVADSRGAAKRQRTSGG